uniref:Putative secreted protein ovary overexpressed n=1 Tax=Rhipicephalus microplus TaxID=6941 RepID=A0A6M2D9F8_RHIMP
MHRLDKIVLLVCSVLSAGFAARKDTPGPFSHDPSHECAPKNHAGSIGTRSICTFSLELDVDPLRMPPEIPIIRCNCPARLCSPTGDFRCMEVWEKIMVSYSRWIDRTRWSVQNETVDVTTGCVCATSRSAPAHNGLRSFLCVCCRSRRILHAGDARVQQLLAKLCV